MTPPRTTLTEVRAVAATHRISRNGFLPNRYDDLPAWSDLDLDMIDQSRAFIRSGAYPYRTASQSYGLKHMAEKYRGEGSVPGLRYVIHGAFIVAAYLEGLTPRRIWYVDGKGRRLTINSLVKPPTNGTASRRRA